MVNPVVSNKASLRFYISIWVFFAVTQSILFYFVIELPLLESLVDSLLFNGTFAVFGLNIFYIARFTSFDQANITNTVITHQVAAALIITAWLFMCNGAMRLVFDDPDYLQFLTDSRFYRAAVGILFYALIVLNYHLAAYYEEVEERKLKESETSRLLKETELSMLKSQINPHFIFNSLNSISSLTLTDPGKAHEMVVNLSSFLRYTIAPQEKNTVSLKEELKAIEDYLAVEKVRFGKRLAFEIHCPDELTEKNLPNMILQPLVENAIKYGVYESTEENKVVLTCENGVHGLVVTIANDIAPDSTPKKGKGIGLPNVKARMKLIYETDDLVEVEHTSERFIVTLTFPQ